MLHRFQLAVQIEERLLQDGVFLLETEREGRQVAGQLGPLSAQLGEHLPGVLVLLQEAGHVVSVGVGVDGEDLLDTAA
jgi:hypothetical protein